MKTLIDSVIMTLAVGVLFARQSKKENNPLTAASTKYLLLIGAVAMTISCLLHLQRIDSVAYLMLFTLLLFASITDMAFGIIPDFALVVGFGFCIMVTGLDTPMLMGALAGGAPLFLVILITRGGMGAGDMKLLAMIGAFIGVKLVLMVLLLSIVSCGIFASVLLLFKLKTLQSKLVFGPFISAATLVVVAFEPQLMAGLSWYLGAFKL